MTDDKPYIVTCRCCGSNVNEFDIFYNTARGNICRECEAELADYMYEQRRDREMMRSIEK